jgi:hypothetical protein
LTCCGSAVGGADSDCTAPLEVTIDQILSV